MFGEMFLSLDHCLTSVCDLGSQWCSVHYLVFPKEVLKCLKVSPLNSCSTMGICRRFRVYAYEIINMLSKGVVPGVHKAVILSSFGVIRRLKVSSGIGRFATCLSDNYKR